jgi:hypothetical protein
MRCLIKTRANLLAGSENPFFIFPASESFSTERRAAQSYRVISVITGSETFVTKAALPDREDRRIADYRKSPFQDS